MEEKLKINRLKENNGITLIALVVTIIVLIILAGVSINLILGDNGIITKAMDAKKAQEKAELIENLQLKIAIKETEKLQNTERITQSEIKEILSEYGTVNKNADGEIESLKPTDKDYEIPFEDIYNGIIVEETPTVEYAKYDEPYEVDGYTHFGTEDWNSGYRISDTGDVTGNIFVWVPCVTDQSKVKPGDTVVTFGKTTEGKYNDWSLGLSPTDTSVTDEEPTNAIKESVEKYGGFYIAAYEAGIEGNKENYDLETPTALSEKPLSKAGKHLWNDISRPNAITVAASMVNTTDGVKSGLISGECWDTTLQWMVNASTNKATNAGYDTNSAGKGWYKDVSVDDSGNKTRHITGFYGVNNIYDMAGNVCEWTTEKGRDVDGIVIITRGGSYDLLGSGFPAANRNVSYGSANVSISFRVVLYK